LKSHNFNVRSIGKSDIVLPGLGFITVTGNVKVKVYVRENTVPYVRAAII